MEHHADFAIPVTNNMRVETTADPGDGDGPIEGTVIALGWWVQPDAAGDPDHVPAGTLYLVVDPRRPPPNVGKAGRPHVGIDSLDFLARI